jgi:hypothetical protein
MSKQSLSEQLWNGLADAVADIREKVVEEPMWGRSLTERETQAPEWPQAREEQQPAVGSLEQTRERAPDIDIDR